MSDLYNPDGALNYEAARDSISEAITKANPSPELTIARAQAAAMLDIAVSLNALTGLALNDFELPPEQRRADPDGDGDEQRGDDEEPLTVDDRVEGLDEADVVIGTGTVAAVGESEGSAWADVSWDVPEGKAEKVTRVWAEQLRRVAPPADPDVEERPDARDVVEHDLDSDFGDATPVECGAHPEHDASIACARKPGHGGKKHRAADGSEWPV